MSERNWCLLASIVVRCSDVLAPPRWRGLARRESWRPLFSLVPCARFLAWSRGVLSISLMARRRAAWPCGSMSLALIGGGRDPLLVCGPESPLAVLCPSPLPVGGQKRSLQAGRAAPLTSFGRLMFSNPRARRRASFVLATRLMEARYATTSEGSQSPSYGPAAAQVVQQGERKRGGH